ncbi:MAG: HmuY family protein [Candidatus Poseidoniales archaeon]
MNYKHIGLGIASLLFVIGGIWAFAISSYEEDTGTSNIFVANDSNENITNNNNNSLFELSFLNAEENLEWSKLRINIQNETETMDCSKGNFTSNDIGKTKVSPKLGSDGLTFTVTIDATSEDEFTHVDLGNLTETNEEDFDMKFSKTDIYLSTNVTGTIVEDTDFEELLAVPDTEFTETSQERLDWYDYKITTHRIEVEDKIYIIKIEDDFYKIKFVSYYNDEDEPRYVSFLIGALEDTIFSALSNSDLVSPAKCMIAETTEISDFWEKDEIIVIYENNFNICTTSCNIKITITYEDSVVKGNREITLV